MPTYGLEIKSKHFQQVVAYLEANDIDYSIRNIEDILSDFDVDIAPELEFEREVDRDTASEFYQKLKIG